MGGLVLPSALHSGGKVFGGLGPPHAEQVSSPAGLSATQILANLYLQQQVQKGCFCW